MLDLQSLKSEFVNSTGPHRVYSEIRYQDNHAIRLTLTNGLLELSADESLRGVSARSFSGGYWGFAAYSNPNKDSAIAALREATRNAKFLAGRSEKSSINVAFVPPVKFEKSYASQKSAVSTAIWLELLKYLDSVIVKKYPDLLTRSLSLSELAIEKHLVTSDGADVHTMVPQSYFTIAMTKSSSHGPITHRDTRGGLGQLQDHFLSAPNAFEGWIDEIYQVATKKSNGAAAKPGVYDVVLAPDLAAMLVHEAVGHAAEADLVLSGSVAEAQINHMVANPLVSITDFAHSDKSGPCPRPVHVDDEGVPAEDTPFIVKGVLKSYLNNRETAVHFEQTPTGHARASSYADEPLIRMRNTAVLPGTSTLEEMLSSVENGYYLMLPGRGQADTTGEFMFAVGTGFEIKNGKLGAMIKDTSVSGFAFEMLQNTSMVGDNFKWDSSGYICMKKQSMPVGLGSPALKTKLRVGGR